MKIENHPAWKLSQAIADFRHLIENILGSTKNKIVGFINGFEIVCNSIVAHGMLLNNIPIDKIGQISDRRQFFSNLAFDQQKHEETTKHYISQKKRTIWPYKNMGWFN